MLTRAKKVGCGEKLTVCQFNVPEETLNHSHPSRLSDILYQLPPLTMIRSILCVQFTCLTVLSNNLSPGPIWSSSWSWTLYFILHTFLHPIIIFFLPIQQLHHLKGQSGKAGIQKGKTSLDLNEARDDGVS